MLTQPKHIDSIPTVNRWRSIAIVLALIAALGTPLWHLHVIDREMPSTHADLLQVMTGVRATLNGLDPYSDQVTREIQVAYYGQLLVPSDHAQKMAFAYPAHTAIVLAPLSLLSWDRLRLGFLVFVPIMMAATVPLWLRVLTIRVKYSYIVVTTMLFLTSWPMMWSLRLQQPTLIVAALLVAGCVLLKHRWDFGAGVFFALSTIKPQLVGPLLVWLVLWTTLQHRWRFLVSFLASTSLLLLCAQWMVPGWFPLWRAALADYAQYTQVRPDLQVLFGRWVGMAVMIAITAASSSILWRLRRCDVDSSNFGIAISLTLAATVSLLPTQPGMVYNQVLLLPAFLVLIYARPADYYPDLARRISVALLGCTFVATILAVVGESIWHPSHFLDAFPFQIHLLPAAAATALMMMTGLRADKSYVPALPPLPSSRSVSYLTLVDSTGHRS
jgi:Glycosyltransferase family 87